MIRHIATLGIFILSTVTLGCSGTVDNNSEPNPPTADGGTQNPLPEASAGDSSPGTSADSGADPYVPPTGPIEWTPCPLSSSDSERIFECATIPVPLNEANPNDGTFNLKVKRVRAKTQPSHGQMWLTSASTTGTSTYDFWSFIAHAHNADDWGVDFYVVDHRGTGDSDNLKCDGVNVDSNPTLDQWNSCGSHLQQTLGNKLPYYSVTESARDLGRLIERIREPGQPVYLYGPQFGSFLLLRYLQLYPNQPSGIVLDQLEIPGHRIFDFTQDIDSVAKAFFDRCGQDPFCSSKLGADPYAVLREVETMLDNGHCPAAGLTTSKVKEIFTSLLAIGNPYAEALPAVVYRLHRCNPGDAQAVHTLAQIFQGTSSSDTRYSYMSVPESTYILLSEFGTYPSPTAENLTQAVNSATMAYPGITLFANLAGTWPHYDPAPYQDQWPTTSVPMLMIHNEFDLYTPLAKALAAKDHFQGLHQTFIQMSAIGHQEIPLANHSTTTSVCREGLIKQFVHDPAAALDTSCVQNLPPISFDVDQGISHVLLGTPYEWGPTDESSSK